PPAPQPFPTRRSSDLQPLGGEAGRQRLRTGILKHPADLPLEPLLVPQLPLGGRLPEDVVRGRAPEEVGETGRQRLGRERVHRSRDRKSTRLNSSHVKI